MIKLSKLNEPQILIDNKQAWTSEYLQLLGSSSDIPYSVKYRYRNPEIKEQIVKETHNKCAYCESKLSHVCPGDVEHILPKAKDARPDLYVEWTNLTLSCEECNRTRKKDYYNPDDPLLNPYVDNPEEHLLAEGPLIIHRPNDRKGEITEKVLEINRTELLERRIDRIKNLVNLADKWKAETNVTLKKIFEKELKKEADPDKEYSFIVKGYLNSIGIVV